MIVCICANVNDRTIREMLKYTNLDTVKRITGACQRCCTCCEALEQINEEVKLLRPSNELD